MKKQILRILLLLVVITGLGFYAQSQGIRFGVRADIVGNLKFTYPGGLTPETLFSEADFKPGDCQDATVEVENLDASDSIVGVYSDGEVETDGLSSVLTITISDDFGILYGSKSLAYFFADSDIINQINLLTLGGGNTANLLFEVCFDETVEDNDLQGDSVVFDLKFGEILLPIELPASCDALEGIVTEVIEGTLGNDRIKGTSASELILGKGGNDIILGGGGHDCIIGDPGNDIIWGGSGNDIISGNEGNDTILGGSGDDVVHAGEGNDWINAGSGDDVVSGGLGDDSLRGGSGIDVINGDKGSDRIWGGSGNDVLLGDTGDDRIWGGSGNDSLDGGPDIDNLNGNSGIDTCVSGEIETSCEL